MNQRIESGQKILAFVFFVFFFLPQIFFSLLSFSFRSSCFSCFRFLPLPAQLSFPFSDNDLQAICGSRGGPTRPLLMAASKAWARTSLRKLEYVFVPLHPFKNHSRRKRVESNQGSTFPLADLSKGDRLLLLDLLSKDVAAEREKLQEVFQLHALLREILSYTTFSFVYERGRGRKEARTFSSNSYFCSLHFFA